MPAKRARKGNSLRAERPACHFCGAGKAVLRGFRKNLSGRKQLFLCRSCGRKFTKDDGFLRMRFPPEAIREAVSLYSKGLSLADVQRRMASRGIKVSRWSILLWVRKYGKGRYLSL